MLFVAAVLIASSLLMSGGDALAVFSLGVAIIGFKSGYSSFRKGVV